MPYDQILMLLSTFLLGCGLCLLGMRLRLFGVPQGESFLDKMLNMNSEQRLMVLTLIGLGAGIFSSLYLVRLVVKGGITDVGIGTMVGTVLGLILSATVNQPWGYWFGSSKGSTDKSALLSQPPADKPTDGQ